MPGWLNHSECKAFWNKPFNRCFKDPVHQDDRLTLWNGFSYFDARRSKGKSRRLWVSWVFICIIRIFSYSKCTFSALTSEKILAVFRERAAQCSKGDVEAAERLRKIKDELTMNLSTDNHTTLV